MVAAHGPRQRPHRVRAMLALILGAVSLLGAALQGHAAGEATTPGADGAAPAAVAAAHGWSSEERDRIVSHGPWPPPVTRDAGNAFSGNPAAIALGHRLFFDTRLAGGGAMSCASCHDPARAWTDGRRVAIGRGPLARNSPTVVDLARARWYGWDGGADSLWSFALRPLTDARELASDAGRVAELLARDPGLACLYQLARGRPMADPAPAADEYLLVATAKAIAAYLETLVSPRTPFDDYRDALASGDRNAADRYPIDARRGLRIFLGVGNCALCHLGPRFTNEEFHHIGRSHTLADGAIDPGRHGGLARVRADRFNRLGPHDDDPADIDPPVRFARANHQDWGAFKTPSLRGVAATAPYMHDGSLTDLGAVVTHYSRPDEERLHMDGTPLIRRLDLDARELADLVAFLRTLSPRVSGPAASPPPAARAAQTDCSRTDSRAP